MINYGAARSRPPAAKSEIHWNEISFRWRTSDQWITLSRITVETLVHLTAGLQAIDVRSGQTFIVA